MKFSIVTCTYNSEKYLQENINSVKNQSFQDFEHVFIDGFSTDKTVEIIQKYQQEFPEKVKFFQFAPKGIANAMNMGIENSSGEYISHLHSDDSFYDAEVLKKVADFIALNKNPEWIYGKANFWHNNAKRTIPHRKIYQKSRFWLLLLTNYIPHQAVFLRRSIFEKYGKFEEQYKNSMDYELWIRLSEKKVASKFLDAILCNYSMRPDSQSNAESENCLRENVIIQKKYIHSKILLLFFRLVLKLNGKRKIL